MPGPRGEACADTQQRTRAVPLLPHHSSSHERCARPPSGAGHAQAQLLPSFLQEAHGQSAVLCLLLLRLLCILTKLLQEGSAGRRFLELRLGQVPRRGRVGRIVSRTAAASALTRGRRHRRRAGGHMAPAAEPPGFHRRARRAVQRFSPPPAAAVFTTPPRARRAFRPPRPRVASPASPRPPLAETASAARSHGWATAHHVAVQGGAERGAGEARRPHRRRGRGPAGVRHGGATSALLHPPPPDATRDRTSTQPPFAAPRHSRPSRSSLAPAALLSRPRSHRRPARGRWCRTRSRRPRSPPTSRRSSVAPPPRSPRGCGSGWTRSEGRRVGGWVS